MAWKWQRGDVARHTGGDLAAALGRITAKTFVMPIDEDMFFPPRDCERRAGADRRQRAARRRRTCSATSALFGVSPTYMPQIDRHLGELLATPV